MNKKADLSSLSDVPEILCPELAPVREVYRNKWFKVSERGGFFTFEYDRPQVVILPVVESRNIIMVRAKRPLMGDDPLELPSGGSLDREKPLETARRELSEETGIYIDSLERFKPITALSESPNRIPFLLSIFCIELSREEFDGRKPFDNKEVTSVKLFSIDEIMEQGISGEIYVSATIAILARFIFSNMKKERSKR